MSVPQYIEMRYSTRLRIITGFTNCLAGLIQMSIFPIIGARFLAVLMKMPERIPITGISMNSELLIMGTICWLMVHLIAHMGLWLSCLLFCRHFQHGSVSAQWVDIDRE